MNWLELLGFGPIIDFEKEDDMSAKKTERNQTIVEMHEQGMTYAEIAKEMGISAARVFVIYHREHERKEKEEDDNVVLQ